jgi:hypothetical protein
MGTALLATARFHNKSRTLLGVRPNEVDKKPMQRVKSWHRRVTRRRMSNFNSSRLGGDNLRGFGRRGRG